MLIMISKARVPKLVKDLPDLAQSRLPLAQAPLSLRANTKLVKSSDGMKLTMLK